MTTLIEIFTKKTLLIGEQGFGFIFYNIIPLDKLNVLEYHPP